MQLLNLITFLTLLFHPADAMAQFETIYMDYSYLIETIEQYEDSPWNINAVSIN